MNQLQISKESALKEYIDGPDVVKKSLENLFGVEIFRRQNITERVKSFEDACKIIGCRPCDVTNPADEPDEAAYKKLKVIVRALNEGWVPDWTNNRQYKYYPWFDLSSGAGLLFDGVAGQNSSSTVGSRLCFKSRELATYAANQFVDLYTQFFIIKPTA